MTSQMWPGGGKGITYSRYDDVWTIFSPIDFSKDSLQRSSTVNLNNKIRLLTLETILV